MKAIKKFFGQKRTQPDVEDLKEIFRWLFDYVPNTTYILDGLDGLDPKEAKSLLGCLRLLFCGSVPRHGSQILLLSRDQIPGYINLSTFMPGIRQITTSCNNMKDIENYIEARIEDKTRDRKLTDNAQLLQEIRRDLLKKSSGMYDTAARVI